jgi:tryptophanyl-tRNA synthetase
MLPARDESVFGDRHGRQSRFGGTLIRDAFRFAHAHLVVAAQAEREPALSANWAHYPLRSLARDRRFVAKGVTMSTTIRIFSGIQPTGVKHLGNYIGAIRQYVASQDDGHPFICIVDLHSITVAHDPVELRESTLSVAALLFAAGLDPERSTVFVQSHVSAHPEAAWLLGSVTSFGELRRMTQFKEKADQQEFVSAGLFTYPVLQAADILLYQTDVVPIGEDQRQHVELTRDIAERFNTRFGETFTLPRATFPEVGARIMDLQEPERKMSTTGGTAHGTVLVLDSPDVIRKKLRSAVTDSGRDIVRSPDKAGITNLIEIMSVATDEAPEAIESRYNGEGYGTFKQEVGEAVVSLLEPVQRRYEELRSDEAELRRLIALGAENARAASAPTLDAMYERMGFARS